MDFKVRMIRKAVMSDTVIGQRSNLVARRAFLWRRIGSDSSKPYGNDGDPMDIVGDDIKFPS